MMAIVRTRLWHWFGTRGFAWGARAHDKQGHDRSCPKPASGRASRRAAILCALGVLPVLALNKIHESSYPLLPRGKHASAFTVQLGSYFHAEDSPSFDVPMAVTLSGSDRLELGAGIKTRWADVPDNVPYLVFGVKMLLDRGTTVHADFLIGTESRADRGLTLGLHRRFGSGGRLYSRVTGKLGFLDALVDNDALAAMELAWYPTLRLMSPLSAELGIITSSQTADFEEHLAMDLQPGLLVHIGGESVVETMVTLGLAGDHKEDLRIKLAIVQGF